MVSQETKKDDRNISSHLFMFSSYKIKSSFSHKKMISYIIKQYESNEKSVFNVSRSIHDKKL